MLTVYHVVPGNFRDEVILGLCTVAGFSAAEEAEGLDLGLVCFLVCLFGFGIGFTGLMDLGSGNSCVQRRGGWRFGRYAMGETELLPGDAPPLGL